MQLQRNNPDHWHHIVMFYTLLVIAFLALIIGAYHNFKH